MASSEPFDLKAVLALVLLIILVLAIVYAIQANGALFGDELDMLSTSIGFEDGFQVLNGKYISYPYWTQLSLSSFFVLSGLPEINSFILLHFLTVIPILCFFILSRTFFKSNKLIAIVATVMFPLFAGFGWIYTLILEYSQGLDLATAIALSSNVTYDISNIANQFAFTLDIAELIGFSCFLIAIYIIRKKWHSQFLRNFLFFSVIILSYLSHGIVDLSILSVILLIHVFLSKEGNQNTKMAFSAILAMFFVAFVDFLAPGSIYTSNNLGEIMMSSSFIAIISLFAFCALFSIWRSKKSYNLSFIAKVRIRIDLLKYIIIFFVILLYILSFILYFVLAQDIPTFSSIQYSSTQWPWFIYPLRFGVVGLFSIMAVIFFVLMSKSSDKKSITFLLSWALIMLFLCLFAKSIPFLPTSLSQMLTENKLQKFLWLPLCIFAAFTFVKLSAKLLDSKNNFFARLRSRHFFAICLISTVFISGFSSTLFEVNCYSFFDSPSKKEYDAFNFLNSVYTTNTSIATITSSSSTYLHGYLGIDSSRIFTNWWGSILYDTTNLESVLNLLNSYNIRYLYIATRDMRYIDEVRANSYLFGHLLNNLEVPFYNSDVTIYKIPAMSVPSNSSTGLIVPELKDDKTIYSDSNTVALYHFDEDSGNIALDSSNNSNVGLILNGTFANGKFDNALLFDGSSTLVNCGNDESLNVKSDIAIEAWVRLNLDWNSSGIIAIKSQGTDWVLSNYYLRVDSQRTVTFIMGDGVSYKKITTTDTLNVDKWHHVSADCNNIYIDGNKVKTITNGNSNVTSHYTTTNNLYIGGYPTASSIIGAFNGLIDELCISNGTAYNYQVITRLYNYYYPTEVLALSNLNYTMVFDEGLNTYSTLIVADGVISQRRLLELSTSGKTVVVFGTHDYGQLSKLFVNENRQAYLECQSIRSIDSEIQIPRIAVSVITSVQNTTVIANYISASQTIPFALMRSYGDGKIIYVNLVPILSGMEGSSDILYKQMLFNKMSALLSVLDLDIPASDTLDQTIYPPPATHIAFGKDISFEGNVTLAFQDFHLITGSRLFVSTLRYNDLSLSDVTLLRLNYSGNTTSRLVCTSGLIADGSWNYANVQLSYPFNWTINVPSQEEIQLTILDKGEEYIIQTSGRIELISEKPKNSMDIRVADLTISVNGLLSFGSLNHKFPFWINQNGVRVIPYSDGKTVLLNGTTIFPVYCVGNGVVYISELTFYGSAITSTVPDTPSIEIGWANTRLIPVILLCVIISLATVLFLRKFRINKMNNIGI